MIPSLSKLSLGSLSKSPKHEEMRTDIVMIWKSKHTLAEYFKKSPNKGTGFQWNKNKYPYSVQQPLEIVIDLRQCADNTACNEKIIQTVFDSIQAGVLANHVAAKKIKTALQNWPLYTADMDRDADGRPTEGKWASMKTLKFETIDDFKKVVNALNDQHHFPFIPHEEVNRDNGQPHRAGAIVLVNDNYYYKDAQLENNDGPVDEKITEMLESITEIANLSTTVDYIRLNPEDGLEKFTSREADRPPPLPADEDEPHWTQYRYMEYVSRELNNYAKFLTNHRRRTVMQPEIPGPEGRDACEKELSTNYTMGPRAKNKLNETRNNNRLIVRFVLKKEADTSAPAAASTVGSDPPPASTDGSAPAPAPAANPGARRDSEAGPSNLSRSEGSEDSENSDGSDDSEESGNSRRRKKAKRVERGDDQI